MKKNLVFKLGLFCAALVLIATCFVSSAWAKYTSTVSATDSARVAKWDVKMTDTSGAVIEDAKFTVFTTNFKHIAEKTEELLAPGSYGQFQFKISDSSEVSVKFDFSAVDSNTAGIPLRWSIYDGSTIIGVEKSSLSEAIAQLKVCYLQNGGEAPEGYTAVTGDKTYTIKWSWAFEGGNDVFDTDLGKLGTDTYEVTITMTATQIAPKN